MPFSPVATATAFVGMPITGGNDDPDTVTVQYDGLTGDRDCAGAVLTVDGVIEDAYVMDATDFELECNGQALVGDIEDVQILYGLTTLNAPVQSAVQYTPTLTAANRGLVVSARVCVQARSANNVTNAPQTYLNCGGALGTATGAAAFSTAGAGDMQLRRTFVATYNLRNRVTSVP
jgi:type IV pilus assembly protein PilW